MTSWIWSYEYLGWCLKGCAGYDLVDVVLVGYGRVGKSSYPGKLGQDLVECCGFDMVGMDVGNKQSVALVQLIPHLGIRNPAIYHDVPYSDRIPRGAGCDDTIVKIIDVSHSRIYTGKYRSISRSSNRVKTLIPSTK